MQLVKENLNESSSYWEMKTMPGSKTSAYPANPGIVYCFKTSFDLKDIFNQITQRYKSARDWKKRFHWDTKLKMWCTQSFESAEEAKETLARRAGRSARNSPVYPSSSHDKGNTVVTPTRPTPWAKPEPKPIQEPIKKLNPGEYDLSTDYLHYNKEDKTLSAEMSDLPPGFSTKHTIIVYNPKTGNTKTFTHYGNDVDGSGEDVYGYKYRSQDGIELLIIND